MFDAYYAKAISMNDDTKLVSIFFKMMEILDASGETYICEVHCKHMGIHFKNRGGKKMVAGTMQKKGAKIYKVGFNLNLCGPDRAIAFEVDATSTEIQDHTISVCSTSTMFANFDSQSIRGGSCGCGHLNQWLAAVFDEATTPYSELCEHGSNNISKRLLIQKSNEKTLEQQGAIGDLERAINNGLRWKMVRAHIGREYPELPTIIQRALNIEHHVGEGDRTR